jgi:hypothetical protein
MMRRLMVLFSFGSLVFTACSSSTAPSNTMQPVDSGTTKPDTGPADSGGSCVDLGDNCAGKGTFPCCVAGNVGAVTCAVRAGTTAKLCLSTPGGSCKSDIECEFGSCASGGVCVQSDIGGPCMVSGDCNDVTDAGSESVTCSPAGVCEVAGADAGPPDGGDAGDSGDAG